MATDIGFTTIKMSGVDLAKAKAALIGIENGFPKAFARALNKSAAGTKTDMVNLTREDYNYKAAHVRSRISVNKATFSRLSASTRSVGPATHLTDLIGTKQTKAGLSVDVKKSTGRQKIKHGFLNKGRASGKLIAFRREVVNGVRAPRYPIEALYAPHPETIYNTPENWKRLSREASARLDSNIDHEVDVVLKGIV